MGRGIQGALRGPTGDGQGPRYMPKRAGGKEQAPEKLLHDRLQVTLKEPPSQGSKLESGTTGELFTDHAYAAERERTIVLARAYIMLSPTAEQRQQGVGRAEHPGG